PHRAGFHGAQSKHLPGPSGSRSSSGRTSMAKRKPVAAAPAQPSRTPAALSRLTAAGIPFTEVPANPCYRVAEAFDFWPESGLWRSLAGAGRGFGVVTLIAAVQSATVAAKTGQDAIAAALEVQP